MPTQSTLRTLPFGDALAAVDGGALFIDLRPTQHYLDVHVPRSIALLYEFGPGMAGRARDCIPLEIPLILLDLGHGDMMHAAASLRGKGFDVLGKVDDAINEWAARRGTPASCDVVTAEERPGGFVLDVGDPEVHADEFDAAIPVERLWVRLDEVSEHGRVVVAAGYGVRAALAIGMLEHAGVPEILFWNTRS